MITYNGVIHKELDKVKDHEDWDEGIEMDIKTETPLHVLVSEVGFQQEFVGDPPETRGYHETNSNQVNEYHIEQELDKSPEMYS